MNKKVKSCSKCGAELEKGQQFCGICGEPVKAENEIIESEKTGEFTKPIKNVLKWVAIFLVFCIICVIVIGIINPKQKEALVGDKIDLYQYRFMLEENVLDALGFEKSDTGMYPSDENMVIWFEDGVTAGIYLNEQSKNKFTFLGVSIGDNMDEARNKFEKCYTYIDSTPMEDTFSDMYQDKEYGELVVQYGMSTNEIEFIMYMPMEEDIAESDITEIADTEVDSGMAETEEPEEATVIETKEYVYWDEEGEIDIIIEYTSETEGYATLNMTLYAEDGTTEDNSTGQCPFIDNGSGWFDIYYPDGELLGYSFEILHDTENGEEYEYMNLLDTSEYETFTLLEKEYAYSNVG